MRTSNETTTTIQPSAARPYRAGPTPRPKRETVPIYVIGGFLGSGKTTLLKRLIRHVVAAGDRPAVVMNEFSDTNVDGALLHEHEDDDAFEMMAIVNGCVCCDLSGELTEEVRRLVRTSTGPVFVETTGLASVEQAADAVARALGRGARRGRLLSVIALVDAQRLHRRRGPGLDPAADIRAADAVVINKVDTLSPHALRAVEARVRALNPGARVFTSAFAAVPVAELLEARRPDIAPLARPGGTSGAPSNSTDGFVTVTATMLGPVLVERLARLLAKYQHEIVRVKGFVRTTETWGLQELQWVPGGLEVRPRKKAKNIRPHLVIVGRGVDWDRFVVDLDHCVRTADSGGRRSS